MHTEHKTGLVEKEASVFTKYLIGEDVDSHTIELYSIAIKNTDAIKDVDKKLLSYMHSHFKRIGLIDAGLAFYNPSSEIRRRLYIMFAILEASPKYYDYFLPIKRSPLYIFTVCFSGLRGVFKAFFGYILIKVVV